ncbi:hypothetical protein [Chryseobacterium sp. T16E-39]|uniref:hypothetical protein n=1 Tax=Chryseobacterium sp. T16E-39 TaxID=2015076 RepID=UPI001560B9D6|nr:hypothetical protein [Chryseobacterium sp. T16E-39]
MKQGTFLIIFFFLLSNCNSSSSKENKNPNSDKMVIDQAELIENVKLAINPKFQDWVLFKNGTYIIFDNADTIKNINDEAISQMKEFGPVFGGGPAGDFGVTHLNKTEGWIVSGHGYGMYTYVSTSEIENKTPNDVEIGMFGRNKRNLDGKNPKIIYVNTRKK